MAKIISVQNNKGGVAKTSSVANLGAILSEKHKVLLIDSLDGQGNLAQSFGVNSDKLKYTLYDVLTGQSPISRAILNNGSNLSILASNSNMNLLGIDVLSNPVKYPKPFHLLKDKLESIVEDYDYILIDSPPSLELMAGNILTLSKELLIPFQPEPFAIRGLIKLLATIERFKEVHNPELKVKGIFGVMVDNRTNLHKELIEQAREYCSANGLVFYDTVVPYSVKVAEAVADEAPIAWLSPKHKASEAYYSLNKEMFTNG